MRLLSGHECQRDPSQAQALLVRLTESNQRDVAADANDILQAGLKRGWFAQTKPFHQDLQQLAARTGNRRSSLQTRKLAVVFGLGSVALLLGVFSYFSRQGAQMPSIVMSVALLGALLIGVLLFSFARR